jgi:hypothetical protein
MQSDMHIERICQATLHSHQAPFGIGYELS